MSKIIRILSIDGGGIRGIIPAQILVRLEQILQKYTKNPLTRLVNYFDFIAGTSTGGIIASILLTPEKANSIRPMFSAQDALQFYTTYGPEIFSCSLPHMLLTGFNLFGEKYSSKCLEKYLKRTFNDIRLSQLLKPCLITAYDLENRFAHFFTLHNALNHTKDDFYVRDIVRATSSAPTYFNVAKIKSLKGNSYSFIDGGVFANNPALCAYTEVCKEYVAYKNAKKLYGHPTTSDIGILSLGTGTDLKPIYYSDSKNWGKAQWALPILDVLISGSASTVHTQLKTIFQAAERSYQYLRIDPIIPHNMAKIGNASEHNIANLLEKGEETATQYDHQLMQFCELLIQNRYGEEKYKVI